MENLKIEKKITENFSQESEKNNNKEILGKQDLYNKIQEEISLIRIEEDDRNREGQILAPNGEISNLSEQEWKMVRTPSFLEKFGNWKEKYNKEEYDLWLKFQKMQKLNFELEIINENIASYQKQDLGLLEEYRGGYQGLIDKFKRQKITINQNISILHAELMNNNFNIHSSNLDYTKTLDQNGEPIFLFRSTSYNLDNEGHFVVPKKNLVDKNFQVGVFLGTEEEANHQHEKHIQNGEKPKKYKVFVNSRNFLFLNEKPQYWGDPGFIKKIQERYDGLWVNNYDQDNDECFNDKKEINLMDYVCFDPSDILITDVE